MCLGKFVRQDADIVFVEYIVNDGYTVCSLQLPVSFPPSPRPWLAAARGSCCHVRVRMRAVVAAPCAIPPWQLPAASPTLPPHCSRCM